MLTFLGPEGSKKRILVFDRFQTLNIRALAIRTVASMTIASYDRKNEARQRAPNIVERTSIKLNAKRWRKDDAKRNDLLCPTMRRTTANGGTC